MDNQVSKFSVNATEHYEEISSKVYNIASFEKMRKEFEEAVQKTFLLGGYHAFNLH